MSEDKIFVMNQSNILFENWSWSKFNSIYLNTVWKKVGRYKKKNLLYLPTKIYFNQKPAKIFSATLKRGHRKFKLKNLICLLIMFWNV